MAHIPDLRIAYRPSGPRHVEDHSYVVFQVNPVSRRKHHLLNIVKKAIRVYYYNPKAVLLGNSYTYEKNLRFRCSAIDFGFIAEL